MSPVFMNGALRSPVKQAPPGRGEAEEDLCGAYAWSWIPVLEDSRVEAGEEKNGQGGQ